MEVLLYITIFDENQEQGEAPPFEETRSERPSVVGTVSVP